MSKKNKKPLSMDERNIPYRALNRTDIIVGNIIRRKRDCSSYEITEIWAGGTCVIRNCKNGHWSIPFQILVNYVKEAPRGK